VLKYFPGELVIYMPTYIWSVLNVRSNKWVKRKCKGKGKAIPLQAWTGPEGSRRLWLPDFKAVGT